MGERNRDGSGGLRLHARAARRSNHTRKALWLVVAASLLISLLTAGAITEAAERPKGGASFHWDPGYPDLNLATQAERAEARRLWQRSKRFARRHLRTPAAARRRGFKGNIRNVKRPPPFFFHLRNGDYYRDGRLLDPRRPEAIVYWYEPPKRWALVGFMFRGREGRVPDLGGPILPWHSHCVRDIIVVHAWFTNDLRSAFARRAPRPEFEEVFPLHDFGDPTPDSAAGCPPPPHEDDPPPAT
jgi:hypothetical protein